MINIFCNIINKDFHDINVIFKINKIFMINIFYNIINKDFHYKCNL